MIGDMWRVQVTQNCAFPLLDKGFTLEQISNTAEEIMRETIYRFEPCLSIDFGFLDLGGYQVAWARENEEKKFMLLTREELGELYEIEIRATAPIS